MTNEVRLTRESLRDLQEIYRYVAVDLQNGQAAERLLDRLEMHIRKLGDMSERFRRYDREPWRSRNLRVMPVEKYLVFYIPDIQERTVTVLRIMYGGRDIVAQLEETESPGT